MQKFLIKFSKKKSHFFSLNSPDFSSAASRKSSAPLTPKFFGFDGGGGAGRDARTKSRNPTKNADNAISATTNSRRSSTPNRTSGSASKVPPAAIFPYFIGIGSDGLSSSANEMAAAMTRSLPSAASAYAFATAGPQYCDRKQQELIQQQQHQRHRSESPFDKQELVGMGVKML